MQRFSLPSANAREFQADPPAWGGAGCRGEMANVKPFALKAVAETRLYLPMAG